MEKGKTITIVVVSAVALIGSVITVREIVAPSFKIISYVPSTHSGRYSFGGVENPFGNGGGMQAGRNGWALETKMNDKGETEFNLYHRKKFIKKLDTK